VVNEVIWQRGLYLPYGNANLSSKLLHLENKALLSNHAAKRDWTLATACEQVTTQQYNGPILSERHLVTGYMLHASFAIL
jgi:hypothetical protein